jgi:hypothetical protein
MDSLTQRFLDYYCSAAQEGETMLIVKQKPQLLKGQKQYHKDGAIKCVWPATLPKYWKPKQALYGNTGVFIIDRMRDRISASAANCDYVAYMVLDDIGTKSKEPKIRPTWIMETSAGNYQWGYGLRTQPTTGEYSAAIIAIAAAGYTDPGAINPVRNFRLPGSINLKGDADNWESRIVDFHPETEIELSDFLAAHDIKPAEADTAKHKVVDLFDDGTDDVMLWLAQSGLLTEKTNGSGWAGVVCPNAVEHTDGNPMARYMPAMRAFSCFHGHCQDWNSERFLRWVAAQGGPDHGSGLRSELLVNTLAPALEKIEALKTESPFAPETNAENVSAKKAEEQELRELGRIEKERLHHEFAYIEDDDAYFDLVNRRELSRSTFNALYRHLKCSRTVGAKGERSVRIEASIWFDEHRQACGSKSLAGLTYAPGESMLCHRDGLVYGNRWVNARPGGTDGDVSPWLKHLERLIPEQFEREHLLDVMAFKVQHPNIKINHAVLMAGHPGVGKDTLFAPFFYAVCGPHEKNKALVDGKALESQFGYGLESEIMVINELRPDQSKDRRALENTLKPIIAAPPEFLTVNRKGLHPYQAVNRLLVVAFSNFRDAVALPSNDRRWFCLWADSAPLSETESRRIWNWYNRGGMEAVAGWLERRDVSMFSPGATPPMTEAKAIMLEQARSSAEEYVIEAIQAGKAPFETGVISAPFHPILDILNGGAPDGMKVFQGTLMHALGEAGWIDMGRLISSRHMSRKRIFARPDIAKQASKSEIRDMAETPVKSTLASLVAVK